MGRGRPPKGGGTEVNLVRTRARQPRDRAEAQAAERLAEVAEQAGAQVFTLYGKPPAVEQATDEQHAGKGSRVALDFYRRLADARGADG